MATSQSKYGRRFDEEFKRAVASHRPASGLLHHSDRGSQYASDAHRELLRRHGVVASMSRPGNCYDNAKMESFWATLKTELIDGQVYATRAEAKRALFSYIEVFYNRARLHGALGYTSALRPVRRNVARSQRTAPSFTSSRNGIAP